MSVRAFSKLPVGLLLLMLGLGGCNKSTDSGTATDTAAADPGSNPIGATPSNPTASAEGGWTEFVPRADTRLIYVSRSDGNDSNDGLSEKTPVQTLARGQELLRDDTPDWLLLKRGDVWEEPFGIWKKSGRSSSEPMLITSYGSSATRPLVQTGSSHGFQTEAVPVSHLAIIGLHFQPHLYTGTEGTIGIRWLANGEDILIEDCLVEGYATNIVVQNGYGEAGSIKNVKIRRSVIVDSYSTNSYSQGLFTRGVDGLLVEECLFDHNGWREGVAGAEATIHNHNMYLQRDCANVTVRGIISANAGASGMQERPGGVCEENLFLQNPTNILFGHASLEWPSQVASGVIRNNVVLGSRDIDAVNPRGNGIWFQNVSGVEAIGNIVAHQSLGTANINGFFFDTNFTGIALRDNVVFDWNGPGGIGGHPFNVLGDPLAIILERNEFENNPAAYPDPHRMIETYQISLGKTPTLGYFLTEARQQSKTNWRKEFTAEAVNTYIRAGFGR